MKWNKRLRWCLPLLLTAVLLLGALLKPRIERQQYPRRQEALVRHNATEYVLDENLLFAVIRTESSFDPCAVSSVGARGLTQIMPDTFRWLQSKTGEQLPLDSLFDPETSVSYGALLLRLLLEEFGTPEVALAAYHAGRGRVNQWLKDERLSPDGKALAQIPIDDTRHYVHKVMKAYQKYMELYGGN
jgi:soluble lytic murein transglycosylase